MLTTDSLCFQERGVFPMAGEIPKEKWSGKVREITLGATREQGGTRTRTLSVGGETALPYHAFEGSIPHPPALALEVHDRKPADWSPLLLQVWGAAMDDPGAWAKAAQDAGDGPWAGGNRKRADRRRSRGRQGRAPADRQLRGEELPHPGRRRAGKRPS